MTRRVRFTPLLAGAFWCAAGLAQAGRVPFETRPPIGTTVGAANLTATADLDRDGDADVVSASGLFGELVAFSNTAGDGSAWTPRTIATLPFGAIALAIGDVDGDGDLDVLSSSGAAGFVEWFENAAGGTVWTPHSVGTELYNGSFISVGDVDRDGDTDVVTASALNNRVRWFENVGGAGAAWVQHIVSSTSALQPRSASLADLDGDGDPDIVVATGSATGFWFENAAGNGSAWTLRTVGLAQGEDEVVAADLDRDGDLDLLVPMPNAAALGWHENTAGNASAWTRRTIATGVAGARSLTAVDLDADGDLDALVPSMNDDTVAWFENVAGDASSWTRRTIATDGDAPWSAVAGDVDGDGDPDVLAGFFNETRVAWYRNATLHQNACFVNRTISTAVDGAQSAFPADVDGDGDPDVVSTAFLSGAVAWHENVGGAAQAFTTRTITTAFPQAARAVAGDVDRDGDVDAAAVQGTFSNGALAWFDNTAGNGSAWTPRTIGTPFGQAGAMALVDLNGDGDLDLLGSGYYTSGVRWFENAAGDGSLWTPATVPASFGGQTAFVAADLDRDSDLDVTSTESFFGDGLGWTENTAGNATTWASHTISSISADTDAMAAVDVDGDGDLDVVQPGAIAVSPLAWFENVGGAGASWTPHSIAGGPGGVCTAGDLDRDGDVDVVAAADGLAVDWHENTAGNGTSWTTRSIVGGGFPGDLQLVDLDRDGDPDLLSTVATSDAIRWHENQGGPVALTIVDQAPATANNSDVVAMLRAVVAHLGRAGDGPLELASLGLLLEESEGDPLTTGEANALVESLRVYRDANGNGTFDLATDALVTSVGTLALTSGVQVVPFTDGDPNVQVTQGTPRTYFVVVELTPNASTQTPHQLRVTLLQRGPSASVAEDRTFDVPLRLACPADVASTIKQAVPVELIGFEVK